MTQFRRFTATNVTVRGLAGFSRLLLIAAGGGAIAFAALAAHAVVVDIGIWFFGVSPCIETIDPGH